jgi:hypothetical protein
MLLLLVGRNAAAASEDDGNLNYQIPKMAQT